MSIFNESRRAIGVAALSAVPFLAACFDVERVDVSQSGRQRLVIDDFEDGNATPASTLFESWKCYPFDYVPEIPACGLVPGYDSQFAYALAFDVSSPVTPSAYGIGAGFGVVPPVGTVDLSLYETVHFDAKLDAGSPAPAPNTTFEVSMVCYTVRTGSVIGGFEITHTFTPTDSWQTYTFASSEFMQPSWQKQQLAMSDKDLINCPKKVNSLNFNVTVPLDPGQSAAGTLTIDNVWLE